MRGLIGIKYDQISLFTTDHRYIATTIIKIESNYLVERKTLKKNNYCALKLATVIKNPRKATKATIGKYTKINLPVLQYEKEMRNWETDWKIGYEIKMSDVFACDDIVDVTGISKGKGTAGPIKRHHFACGPKSHGSHFHRRAGSLGSIVSNRVFKNMKNAGRMGNHKATIKNLQIIYIDEKRKYLIVKGLIPGPRKQVVYVQTAKGNKKKGAQITLNSFAKQNDKTTNTE